MKTCIKLDEEDLKNIVKNHFIELRDAKVTFFVERNAEYGGSPTHIIRAEVMTEEEIIAR